MTRDLSGQRILITGASGGIGTALALQAADAGRVWPSSAVRSTSSAYSPPPGACDRNARDPGRRDRGGRPQTVLDAVVERWGGLDVLINNAGVGSFGQFADCSEAILRKIMALNFFAPAELIRLAIPILTRAPRPAIVNVAALCGRRGMPAWSEYSASKFALCGLTEALHGELVRFGIDVLLIVPGLTNTELGQHLLRNEGRPKIEVTRAMTAEQVATGMLQALRRRRTETVIGGAVRWMLLMNRFFPRLVDRLLARRMRKLYAS